MLHILNVAPGGHPPAADPGDSPAGDLPGGGLPPSGPRLAVGPGPALAAGVAAVVGLIVCGWFLLRPGPATTTLPDRQPVPVPSAAAPAEPGAPPAPPTLAAGALAAPAGAPGSVSVYIVGQVRKPGVVTLPPGARVVDAVEAARGATARADLAAVNLARRLADGEQIIVPRRGEVVAGGGGPGGLAGGSAGGGSGAAGPGAGAAGTSPAGAAAGSAGQGVLNLNTATVAQLDELPGVGPVIAGRIVAWRQENGPFTKVDQLGEVEGIGPATLGKLRPLVTV